MAFQRKKVAAALAYAVSVGTTATLLTAVLAFAAWQGRLGPNLYGGAWTIGPWDLHPLALLFALSGTLMISKTLRIPKF